MAREGFEEQDVVAQRRRDRDRAAGLPVELVPMRIVLSVALLAIGVAVGAAFPPVSRLVQTALAAAGMATPDLLPPAVGAAPAAGCAGAVAAAADVVAAPDGAAAAALPSVSMRAISCSAATVAPSG